MSGIAKILLSTVAVAWLASAASAQADEVKLYNDKGFWQAQMQQVGDAAEKKTGVKIVASPYSSPEQYKAFIQASLTSGSPPDMFSWWTGQTFKDLVASGQIAPLDDVWKEMVASGQYDPSSAALFTVDGHPYGVPMLLARWVVLYNKDMFKEVGISEPKTWDDLMADAAKLKAAGHTPFEATVQEGWRGFIWFQELMLRTDPKAFNGLSDGTVPYDSDAVKNAFKIWGDLYAKGYFSDPRSNEEAKDFASGKAAMYLIGEWAQGIVEKAGLPADKIGVFIMPNVDASLPSSVIVEGGPIVVSKAGKEKKSVMTALNFWSSVDGANVWAAASGNYMGNLKANAPNANVSAITAAMTANKTQAYLRWWEAVPPDLQGEMVALLNGFELDPSDKNAADTIAKLQALNVKYWSSKK
jgi:ABC-type glycerol-3-phosphate transport system substrate-binding protein